ncbi:hypothetical protein HYDPIDRAFT_44518 [Hydnomerulius pinastri MD-312]|uniref:Monocarboxylate transporter n=1 Tax=Hydnomerulius pinastri MD-312 TaxID=994086 RepID=A0A0C9W6E7_9AGAM|nr:hypothetical protein HYDPIDRAFT_44518 [Hydnomerulius pinastri MD-312]
MIISNIGTIVLSLPHETSLLSTLSSTPSSLATATQVRTLSLANTLSRLIVGPLADIVSPVPSSTGAGERGSLRKHLISRIAFLTFSTAVLVCTYGWMVVGVRGQGGVWALSIGAGTAYGCAFTVLPSLVSSVWGLSNLGRNYGILTYAPFLGTPAFSYLYAFVAAAHSPADEGLIPRGWQFRTLSSPGEIRDVPIGCLRSQSLCLDQPQAYSKTRKQNLLAFDEDAMQQESLKTCDEQRLKLLQTSHWFIGSPDGEDGWPTDDAADDKRLPPYNNENDTPAQQLGNLSLVAARQWRHESSHHSGNTPSS